jgi:multimeric flavodoxin WrbA
MATVLIALCSGRKHGYTAGLWRRAADGAAAVDGVVVDAVHLHDYRFGPCTSCFSCIRHRGTGCVLEDDFGRNGEGELYRKVAGAHAVMLVDAVHNWGPSAIAHSFIERLYPLLWAGTRRGVPFASISCATNQGMHHLALENYCKWAGGLGLRYVGGLAVHATFYDEALREAQALGSALAQAAADFQREGPGDWSDLDLYRHHLDQPWGFVGPYLHNLTGGSMDAERSLIARAIAAFRRPEAVELLRQALPELRQALRAHAAGKLEEAIPHLVAAGSRWTHATWKEFLEDEAIGTPIPETYRPLENGSSTTGRGLAHFSAP